MQAAASGLQTTRLSVIVPVYNGGEGLRRCLQGLAASSRPPDEVITVDDGSTDASAANAAALGARVLTTPAGPRGPAHARNRGAEAATGDVLVFIDADVVVHADTLARMESVMADEPDVVALFGCYDDDPPARNSASLFKNLLHHYVHQHGDREAGTFWSGCGAVRRTVFLAAGGFDEAWPAMEDVELGVRLRQAGQRIRLCPEVQAKHLKRWTLASLWHTDIFARAIPWTRLILRQGRLSCDLNLNWRSRLSALGAWALLACALLVLALALLGPARLAGWAALGVLLSAAGTAVLNADLYAFFFRRGGARFALMAAALHVGYLLYSSLVFTSLLLRHRLRGGVRGLREPTTK